MQELDCCLIRPGTHGLSEELDIGTGKGRARKNMFVWGWCESICHVLCPAHNSSI